eukprot:CAMPEP_0206466072 /NCGR_PEP_ID=MMETSP0324_2-20121206/28230_1 /ASSEMBLY_ACC=CAM_ASM_000836 /TAXON_ID=2866 /ORGANISM="Crypthecodinium cohnii, Strain Seligo" /LENGTH=232 /DNA_ID=CAMNT_0053939097 /DNA_START=28 /DNA_END=726 /DNA_ORIENTATION=+
MAVRIFPGSAVDPVGAEEMSQLRREALQEAAKDHYDSEELQALLEAIGPSYFQKLPSTFKVIVYLDALHATDSEHLSGFAIVGTRTKRLTALYVHPARWHMGIGRELVQAARPYMMDVESTLNAVPFFRACGMGLVGDAVTEAGSRKLKLKKLAFATPPKAPAADSAFASSSASSHPSSSSAAAAASSSASSSSSSAAASSSGSSVPSAAAALSPRPAARIGDSASKRVRVQ